MKRSKNDDAVVSLAAARMARRPDTPTPAEHLGALAELREIAERLRPGDLLLAVGYLRAWSAESAPIARPRPAGIIIPLRRR